jgi:tetratricopeptide (TPR) repeat protein
MRAVSQKFSKYLFTAGILSMSVITACHAQAIDKKKALKNFELAQMLQFNANLQGAAAALHQAILYNPDYYEAHLQLANLEVRLGEKNEAVKEFQELVRLKPTDVPARLALGSALRSSNRNQEAIATFKAASALPHTGSEPETQMAFTYIEADDLENAINEFEKLIKIEPNSVANMLGLSIAQFRHGDTEKAKQSLTKVLELNPREATAISLLGDLEIAAGNKEAGIADYRKAINADNRFAQPYIALGNLYLKENDFVESETVFKQAFENCPANFAITFGLAQAEENLSQKDKAITLYERALRMPESSDKLRQVKLHLRQLLDKQ